jgi:PAS domain S-box-containing protein
MLNRFKDFIKSNASDPDEIRRQRLINILSIGLGAVTLVGLIFVVIFLSINPEKWQKQDNQLLVLILFVGAIGSLSIYLLNRYSGRLASSLFLLFLTIISAFSDTPEQLANGRSLFVFMVTIAISSQILSPVSSFIFASINSVIVVYLAELAGVTPNSTAIFAFFFFALISWLSARSLEQALKDLRAINLNLDNLVEQKTRELAATLSRELILAGRNQAILNSIADGVIVFDEQNKAILANPALSQLTEIPVENVVSRNVTEFIQNEALSSSHNQLKSMFENPQQNITGVRINWANKTLSASIARVQDSSDKNIGTVAVFRDITREAELEKMKDTFMGIVSHELRTPLNAILGYAEMLKEGVYGAINEKQSGVAQRVMNNTQRLLTIVSDLLDQAQIQSGKLKIRMVSCKPAELLEALHGVMDKIVQDKGIEFTTELDPALPSVIIGDAQRLQQIMINLSTNAVKFTEKGGVNVKLSKLDEAHWQIQTTDTGGGIPSEAKDYIFESFRQVEGSATRQHGGVGLGLSIVKQLVELMKGKITVESEMGKGSTFTVVLPFALNGEQEKNNLNEQEKS